VANDSNQNPERRSCHSSKILQTHLRSHPEHDQLDDDQDHPSVAKIEIAPLEEGLREDHRNGESDDNPGRELIAF